MDDAERQIEAHAMSGDRTMEGAHARIDLHEAVCAERYKSIDKGLNEVKAMLLSQGNEFHARMNTISNRMWLGAIGFLAASAGGLGTLVFYLLTKEHH